MADGLHYVQMLTVMGTWSLPSGAQLKSSSEGWARGVFVITQCNYNQVGIAMRKVKFWRPAEVAGRDSVYKPRAKLTKRKYAHVFNLAKSSVDVRI